jgi:lipid II:glycine glycyltransferase (peptidoglycan interpeptide bridge formation enzyme)
LAAMLFLRHDPVVTYHLGWTGIQGRKWGLHHRLLMAAANHFAHAGLSRMDLGTVDTEQSAGLARFKIGSGALVRPLGGTWLRLPF